MDKAEEFASSDTVKNVKTGAEEALNKAVDGAKDLADKIVENDIVKNVKSGTEDALNKAGEVAKDLVDKASDLLKKK